jgi:hypothetical protein
MTGTPRKPKSEKMFEKNEVKGLTLLATAGVFLTGMLIAALRYLESLAFN